MERSPSWETNRLVKKFSAFYGTPRFIIAYTKTPLLLHILSQINPVISSHSTCCSCFLILSSQLRLGLTIGLFPPGLPSKTLDTPLLSRTHATCPVHLILDLITRTILILEWIGIKLQPVQGSRTVVSWRLLVYPATWNWGLETLRCRWSFCLKAVVVYLNAVQYGTPSECLSRWTHFP